MNRTATVLTILVLVIGSVSVVPMAAVAQVDASTATSVGGATHAQVAENASDDAPAISPGERFAGVVGVGQAEFEGELELRAYGIEYAMAATNEARADVVAERLGAIDQRLDALAAEKAALDEARENGSISEQEYRTRATELAASSQAVAQQANASEARADELPAELLEEKGINVTAIQRLKTDAANLTGPEVAAIARTIAGPDIGQSITRGPPEDVGASGDVVPSPDDRGDSDARTATERADREVAAAEMRLTQAEARVDDGNEEATAALEAARAALDRAQAALDDARAAMAAGDENEAADHAGDAIDHAQEAADHAQDALDAAQDSDQANEGNRDGSRG